MPCSLDIRRQRLPLQSPLQLGKLSVRGRLNTVILGPLVHVCDQISGRCFLVDTDAAFSIFPLQSSDTLNGPLLSRPAGRNIPCWGERWLDLCFNGRCFQWTFLLAAIQFPILGLDFLRHFRLLVNPSAGSLLLSQHQQRGPNTVATELVWSSPSSPTGARRRRKCALWVGGCELAGCHLGPSFSVCSASSEIPGSSQSG